MEDENEVWDVVSYYIAQLCLNILLITSVNTIVLGGGVMNRKILYSLVNNHFVKMLNSYLIHPRL